MSRGAGAVMVAALEALTRLGMADALTLAGEIYGRPVTHAGAVSVRRALRSLEARGEAEDLGRGFRFGRRMWATPDRAREYRDRVARTFGPGAVTGEEKTGGA